MVHTFFLLVWYNVQLHRTDAVTYISPVFFFPKPISAACPAPVFGALAKKLAAIAIRTVLESHRSGFITAYFTGKSNMYWNKTGAVLAEFNSIRDMFSTYVSNSV